MSKFFNQIKININMNEVLETREKLRITYRDLIWENKGKFTGLIITCGLLNMIAFYMIYLLIVSYNSDQVTELLNNSDRITYEELLVINLNGDLYKTRKSLSKEAWHKLRENMKKFYQRIKDHVSQHWEKITLI